MIPDLFSPFHSQRRLPLQLQNATASLEAPILYPAGVDVNNEFPRTKRELLRITGKQLSLVRS
jgi:hypothetical protein